MADFTNWLAKFLGHTPVEGGEALVIHGLQVAFLWLCAFALCFYLQRAITRHLEFGDVSDESNVFAYRKLAYLAVLVPTLAISLHILGINMAPFFATGGIFALAFGFGMKNVAENFISGVILRFQKSTKPGNIIELNGAVMLVKSVGLRSTHTDTFNGREILIPNSDILKAQLGTFTLSDNNCRIQSRLRVKSEIDPSVVQKILLDALVQQDWTAEGHKSEVILTGFEDDLVCYKVFAWLDSPAKIIDGVSQLNRTIWRVLADNDIALGVQTIKLDPRPEQTKHENPQE